MSEGPGRDTGAHLAWTMCHLIALLGYGQGVGTIIRTIMSNILPPENAQNRLSSKDSASKKPGQRLVCFNSDPASWGSWAG